MESLVTPTKPMTRGEEPELIARAKAGDEAAMTRVLTSLVKLVRSDAKRWGQGVDEQDLVQAGLMGVAHAVEKFDPSFGVRFATYAGHWWRHSIRRTARAQMVAGRGGTTSILCSRYSTVMRAMGEAFSEGGDVAGELAKRAGIRRDVAEGFIALQTSIASLDTDFSNDAEEWSTVESRLGCGGEGPIEKIQRSEVASAVREALETLPARQRDVLAWRFLSRRPMTLADIGRKLGVSRERARQIEVEALGKLRKRLELRRVA